MTLSNRNSIKEILKHLYMVKYSVSYLWTCFVGFLGTKLDHSTAFKVTNRLLLPRCGPVRLRELFWVTL